MRHFGGGVEGKKETPCDIIWCKIQFTRDLLVKETCIYHFC